LRQRVHLEVMTKNKNKTKRKVVYSRAKYLLNSPKKIQRIADLIRGKMVSEALSILKNLPHRSAALLYKCVFSAQSNAVNNDGMELGRLIISELLVNEGPRHKRFQPRARGRMFQIIKRTSHIIVGVTEGES